MIAIASGPRSRAVNITPTEPVENAMGKPKNMRINMDPNIKTVIHSMLSSITTNSFRL
jgi:hypothetical protein